MFVNGLPGFAWICATRSIDLTTASALSEKPGIAVLSEATASLFLSYHCLAPADTGSYTADPSNRANSPLRVQAPGGCRHRCPRLPKLPSIRPVAFVVSLTPGSSFRHRK